MTRLGCLFSKESLVLQQTNFSFNMALRLSQFHPFTSERFIETLNSKINQYFCLRFKNIRTRFMVSYVFNNFIIYRLA